MRGPPDGAQAHAQNATCGCAEAVIGRLSVDQELDAGRRVIVGDTRAVAAALLTGDEQEPNMQLPARTQPFGGCHLRRQNALGVARSAAEQEAVLVAAG